jgi:Tol biopolymer transport system component
MLIAYESFSKALVHEPGSPPPQQENVFLLDRATGEHTLVSHLPGGGYGSGIQGSLAPQISDDGTVIAFESYEPLAGEADASEGDDVYRYDVATGTNEKFTVGGQASSDVGISADGHVIVYQSNGRIREKEQGTASG